MKPKWRVGAGEFLYKWQVENGGCVFGLKCADMPIWTMQKKWSII